jgi:O-antigen ligase
MSVSRPQADDVSGHASHPFYRVMVTAWHPAKAIIPWSWIWRGSSALLILGSALTAPLGKQYGITLTGDRLLGLLALAVVAALGARGRVRWTGVHSALAMFVGAQVLTTVIDAPAWPSGLKFVTIYVLGFACFALAAECARGPDGQRRMVWSWIAVGVLLAVTGTLTAGLSNLYQEHFWGTGRALIAETWNRRVVFAAKATFGEYNLFSSFLLIPFTLALWAWRRGPERQRPLITAIGALVFGLAFGATRAVWLAAAAIVAVWWRVKRPRPLQLGGLALMLGLALLFQTLVVVGGGLATRRSFRRPSLLASRITEPMSARYDFNMLGRLAISRETLASWSQQPVLGRGAGSINRLSAVLANGKRVTNIWNGNIVLFVLHDSGLLGLATLVGLAAVVWRRAWCAIKREAEPSSAAFALLVAGVALSFAYQFTHALWLMYPYVYLGLVTAATEGGAARA